jgi:hypothetical protein
MIICQRSKRILVETFWIIMIRWPTNSYCLPSSHCQILSRVEQVPYQQSQSIFGTMSWILCLQFFLDLSMNNSFCLNFKKILDSLRWYKKIIIILRTARIIKSYTDNVIYECIIRKQPRKIERFHGNPLQYFLTYGSASKGNDKVLGEQTIFFPTT